MRCLLLLKSEQLDWLTQPVKVNVKGHARKDGSYVKPHQATRKKAVPKVAEVTAVTWTAKAGDEIKIDIGEYLDRAVANAYVNGKRETESGPVALKDPFKVDDQMFVARVGRVVLTQDRLNAVRDAMTAVQAEIDARPDVKMRNLVAQRKRLASEVGYIIDAAHYDHVRYIEQVSADGFAKRSSRDFAAEEQAARAALAEFDAAHPEVAVKIEADKAAAVARFLAID